MLGLVVLWGTLNIASALGSPMLLNGSSPVEYSIHGKQLATASRWTQVPGSVVSVYIYETATGNLLHNLTGHDGGVGALAFSPDDKHLASTDWGNKIRIWDKATGNLLLTFDGPWTDSCNVLAYSPDSKHLVAVQGETISLYDAANGKDTNTFKGHTGYVESVAYSPDGKHLASGSDDRTIRIWDVATGKSLNTFKGHTDKVQSVAYSPDGKRLASASDDKTIRIWDVVTGKSLNTFEAHLMTFDRMYMTTMAYSQDGKHLASASDDKTIRIWDAATGKLLRTLAGHTSLVLSVAYSPDGKHLASGSEDNTVRIWTDYGTQVVVI